MSRMRRINIVIGQELDDRLEGEAQARGLSKSALVRECVEARLAPRENGLRWIGELSKYTAHIESADIDTELYGPLEVDT
ncbi:MAG: ribbon-helix-helix protein, CopG family [Actinobacteria bacterium]|nr:ribbon-helix-helix protein, CopG family [Actinomycetota bacterium]